MKITGKLENTNSALRGLLREPFYPFLFAVFPALFLYAHNIGELTLDVLLAPICLTLIVTCLLYFIFHHLYKSWPKAGALLMVWMIIFYGYGLIAKALPDEFFRVGSIIVGGDKVLFPAGLLLLFAAAFYWRSLTYSFAGISRPANIILLALAGASLWQILPVEWERFLHGQHSVAQAKSLSSDPAAGDELNKPDVYYLIFDRYSGNDALLSQFHYDNTDFTDWMQTAGFYVAKSSLANYLKTSFSLSSSLNMDYHDALAWIDRNPSEAVDVYPLFRHNKVQQHFHQLGYRNYILGSWFWPTAQSEGVDRVYQYLPMSWVTQSYASAWLNITMAGPIYGLIVGDDLEDPRNKHYVYTKYQLDTIDEVVGLEGPKFVFAHFLLPHGPNVFNENCEYLELPKIATSSDDGYIGQIKCANLTIKRIVEGISTRSSGNSIIIVQADEGGGTVRNSRLGENNVIDRPDEALIERANILNAYYFPDHNYSSLYQHISPVNSFRLVFDQYFNQNYPLLDDRTYGFSTSESYFEMMDITERMKLELDQI